MTPADSLPARSNAWWTRFTAAVVLAVACAACDGVISGQIKVLASNGQPVQEALIRRETTGDHDLARYTDSLGCAHVHGVVGPSREVRVRVEKVGFAPRSLEIPIGERRCYVVQLAREGSDDRASVETIPEQECTCPRDTGYSPTLAARFRVTGTNGEPLDLVGVRRSDRPTNPWSQVTDGTGCLGITWIIPAGTPEVPLVLERSEYQPVSVSVPAMQERCFDVTLVRTGQPTAGRITMLSPDACKCQMFTGRTVWPSP